jgi:hypothetical protein
MKACTSFFRRHEWCSALGRGAADSMYEAAAAPLEIFHEHECSPSVGSHLEIQVRSAVTHTLAMKKLNDWADLAGGSPRDVILKGRMKRVLARESATRARDSDGHSHVR